MSLDITLKCAHCEANNYESNITHNLNTMADKAGIYEALWRPYRLQKSFIQSIDRLERDYDLEMDFENGCEIKAVEIIPILEKGLDNLKKRPKYFKQFNAENGWGLYEHFVPFVEKYLEACRKYPDSIIEVSR